MTEIIGQPQTIVPPEPAGVTTATPVPVKVFECNAGHRYDGEPFIITIGLQTQTGAQVSFTSNKLCPVCIIDAANRNFTTFEKP